MAQAIWQPTHFKLFERSFDSSTQPARIMTDAGSAYIKVINNRLGPHTLAREWIGTNLARWFNLPTFDFAIMDLDAPNLFPLSNGEMASAGPAFVTRTARGHPWGGTDAELDMLENPDTISRLVVFDTWTLNADRHPPDLSRRGPHYDNVFLSEEGIVSGKLRLIVMDHTECFLSSVRPLSGNLATIDRVKDSRIYGLFPQFHRFLRLEHLNEAVARLRELTHRDVRNIVRLVPREWEVDEAVKTNLCDLIFSRAGFVADTIEGRLLPHCTSAQYSLFPRSLV